MTTKEFEQLIIQNKEKLFRFAFSILKNGEDAQDAVQEVVLKLWKNKQALDKTKNIESFCMTSIKNYCFDIIRRQKHLVKYQNTAIPTYEELNVENVDFVEKLKKELYQLPTQQRMAIELKDFQGYEYNEISEILEQSINTVRVSVSRGRKKLYKIFKEELKNE